ncbi:MAG: dTDP-4-dehydrorhamnose reductase [bacterium]
MAIRKVLVTGCRGQLGADLISILKQQYTVNGVDIEDLDIRDYQPVLSCLRRFKPDAVLHAAACTDVDGCETDRSEAVAVNVVGSENVARACREIGAGMVYYSTDYVFDGTKTSPYVESDATGPRTVYGQTKLDGEMAVAALLDDYAVLRIAWLYGRNGKNFVSTMLQLGRRQIEQSRRGEKLSQLKVVDDQWGSPCWTVEIARQTGVIIANNLKGIFHVTAEGETTWYGVARRIFDQMNMPVQLTPCSTDEFPRPAPRPHRSTLENKCLKKLGLNIMRPWEEALDEFLRQEGEALRQ